MGRFVSWFSRKEAEKVMSALVQHHNIMILKIEKQQKTHIVGWRHRSSQRGK